MKYKKLITALILISLLVIYFWKVVFLGRALSSTDNLYMYPPYSNYIPIGFERPVNSLLGDQTSQFYPFLFYARQEIRNGHLPLWNPYIMMGMPFIADAQSAVLYPINIVFYTFPFKDAFAMSAFIRLFIAGFGMFLFADALGLEFLAALFAGISFMFCAFNIVWLNHPLTNVSVFLPWLFLLSYKFINTGRLRYAGWLSIITGIQFLGGHPETSAYILLAAMIYVITLLVFQYKNKKPLSELIKKFGLIIISLILGFMIASPMLLPFISELVKSATWSLRSKPNAFFLSLKVLPVFLAPQFYGTPIYNNYWGPANFNEQSGYVGIAALILAVITMVYRRYRNREVLFFFFLALGSLLIVFGIPPFFQIFTALPYFSHMVNQRLILIYQFSTIMLSGIGIDIILRWSDNKLFKPQTIKDKKRIQQTKAQTMQPITFKRLVFIGIIAAISFLAIEITFSVFMFTNGEVQHSASTIYKSIMISIIFMVLFIAILYSAVSYRKKAIMAIIGLQFIDLFVFGHNYNPQLRKEWIFPQIPLLSQIKHYIGDCRFVGLGPTYAPNTLMSYGIKDIRGYDFPVNKRYNVFFTVLTNNEPSMNSYLIMKMKVSYYYYFLKYLQLMSVKYIGGTSNGYIVPGYKQRAYLAHEIIPADKPSQALELVKTDIDKLLQDSVVIEGENNIHMTACSDPGQDAAQIVSYEPDKVILFTASKCNSILVLTDTYDSGWKAYVDEKQVPILHANYLFRGIYLEPGIHRVEFEYKPFPFKLGMILCAIALVPVIISLFL